MLESCVGDLKACNFIKSRLQHMCFRFNTAKYLVYTCLIPWKILKTTHGWCEWHALTLLSMWIVLSSLPWLSSMVSRMRNAHSFQAACQQKLLLFAPNTVKMFQIPWYSLFLWMWFCNIKITIRKAIFNSSPYSCIILQLLLKILHNKPLKSVPRKP